MRKEFVPCEYEQILLRRLKRIKQGNKTVRTYHDELSCAMRRANIVDDKDVIAYFKSGLNPNIVAAIEGKYFRSVHNLLSCAIKEEKKIKELQQDKFTRCIDLCQEITARLCAELQSIVSSVNVEKKASMACRKKVPVVPKCDSIASNAKCAKNDCFDSSKSFVVQRDDKFVPQFDMGRDMVCDVTSNHGVTPNPIVIAILKFSSTVEDEQEKATLQAVTHHEPSCENREHVYLSVDDVLSEQLKEDENGQYHNQFKIGENVDGKVCNVIIEDDSFHNLSSNEICATLEPKQSNFYGKREAFAAVFPSECDNFVQQENQETSFQLEIAIAVVPTSYVPCSSAICGEIQCTNAIENCDMQHGANPVTKYDDLELEFTPIADFEKKNDVVVPPGPSDKSVQKEVEHVSPNLQLQTDVVPTSNEMSRCVIPSAVVCDELLDKDAEMKFSNMPLEIQIEAKNR